MSYLYLDFKVRLLKVLLSHRHQEALGRASGLIRQAVSRSDDMVTMKLSITEILGRELRGSCFYRFTTEGRFKSAVQALLDLKQFSDIAVFQYEYRRARAHCVDKDEQIRVLQEELAGYRLTLREAGEDDIRAKVLLQQQEIMRLEDACFEETEKARQLREASEKLKAENAALRQQLQSARREKVSLEERVAMTERTVVMLNKQVMFLLAATTGRMIAPGDLPADGLALPAAGGVAATPADLSVAASAAAGGASAAASAVRSLSTEGSRHTDSRSDSVSVVDVGVDASEDGTLPPARIVAGGASAVAP